MRLLRGIETGVYTHYVDIPITGFEAITDFGYHVSNGHRWRSIINTDTNDTGSFDSMTISADSTVVVKGSKVPSYGSWKKGDRIINTNIAVGKARGWVCSESGSPGIWLSEGNY